MTGVAPPGTGVAPVGTGDAPAGTEDAAATAARDMTETTVIAAINFLGATEGASRPSDAARRGAGG